MARTSERARLIEHGTPHAVSPALALTIYRVTQEALTNFLKHAGPGATASVTLTYTPSSITVDVLDDGTGVDDPTDGGGNGLRGMYERVIAMGARCTPARATTGQGSASRPPSPPGTCLPPRLIQGTTDP